MPRLTKRRAIISLLLILTIALAGAGQKTRLWEQGLFSLQEWSHAQKKRDHALWLPDYRATIDGKVIDESIANLSALTFDAGRNSLFAVTNKNAEILELSLEGEVIRRIRLVGFGDPEAIEYVEPGHFVIADERLQTLYSVQITDNTESVHIDDSKSLSIGINLNGNKGFEALAYDRQGQRLFAGKERDPVTLYEIHGFPQSGNAASNDLKVLNNPEHDQRLFVADISSLIYDHQNDHLLVLSDQSKYLLEVDAQHQPVSSLSLTAGKHGLTNDIPQAEGATLDAEGNLYIVSEPNLFYRFERETKP